MKIGKKLFVGSLATCAYLATKAEQNNADNSGAGDPPGGTSPNKPHRSGGRGADHHQSSPHNDLTFWTTKTFPNPQTDPEKCGSNARVCDPDGVLNDTQLDRLAQRIQQLESTQKMTCNNAKDGSKTTTDVQMAVAIAKKMNMRNFLYRAGDGEAHAKMAAELFATTLHDEWGVGEECADAGSTGLLLFLSILDRTLYISRGGAIEPILTDRRLDKVIDSLKPWLREGRYDVAMLEAVGLIEDHLERGEPSASELRWQLLEEFFPFGFLGLLVAFVGYSGYRQRRAEVEYAQVESQLSQMDRDRAEALQGRYRCTSCPICLEPFQIPQNNTNGSEEEQEQEQQPKIGSDGQPLRLLRCGHVFDETCWSEWVTSGTGNVRRCPICQQDVGSSSSSDGGGIMAATMDHQNFGQNNNNNGDENNNDGGDVIIRNEEEELIRRHRNERMLRQYQRERNFRLARMAMRHPRYIRPQQVQRWTSTTYDGQLVRDPTFVQNNPTPRFQPNHQSSSSGSSSSSSYSRVGTSSFGGGRSAGGRGGSW